MATMAAQREALRRLRERLATISDLSAAGAVLAWDQQTFMPGGGIKQRAEQLATLSRLSHEMLVSVETGRLLDAAGEPEPGTVEHALLRVARREYERATRVPADLVADLSRAASVGQQAWERARAASDWEGLAPYLKELLDLQRRTAEHLGYEDHPYDALLDIYEPGARKARLEGVFAKLKAALVPMTKRLPLEENRSKPLFGDFEEARQEEFGRTVITAFGYDWAHGRQDRAAHPFCISLGGPADVRITTRFDPGWLSPALFATFHEAGHAIYEQGVDPAHARTPLAGGASMGLHESQSRLWENLVGRSRAFWEHYYPELQRTFPEALGGVDPEDFYRAVNEAKPSPIRVDADELTYNLHILIRFELEVAMLEGALSVEELPPAWNEKTEEYLGLVPGSAATGVLQDVHWAAGLFGYFPTYALGNVLSVQLFERAVEEQTEIPQEIRSGEFGTLLGWLREKVHRHGKRYDPDDLVERATGRPLEPEPYLRYLREKFGELYALG